MGTSSHLQNFYEEVQETVSALNESLVHLEQAEPDEQEHLVNDIFRYFHNLKGNSGILGYKEFNALTHEAETLLNGVRKGEIPVSRAVIDLLLSCLDSMENLATGINLENGEVTPVDVEANVAQLRACIENRGAIPARTKQKVSSASGGENDDLSIFKDTANQQKANIYKALGVLKEDGQHKESIDSLYRSLVTIQNSASYMEHDDLKVYTERTASLVNQTRNCREIGRASCRERV